MKILVAPSSYPPVLGGLQIVCEHIVHGLEAGNEQVRVLTNRVPLHLPRREKKGSSIIHRWWFPDPDWIRPKGLKSLLFQLLKYIVYPITWLRLGVLLFLYRPEIVNVHHPQSMIRYFLFWKRFIAFKLVTSIHGYDLDCFIKPENRKVGQFVLQDNIPHLSIMQEWLKQSDLIICNSQYMAKLAAWLVPDENLPQKMVVLPNAIEPARFLTIYENCHECIAPYLFAFGRLDVGKGLDILVKAFTKIKDRIAFNLIIAGEGPDRKLLEDIINENGLEKRVVLLGRITQEEVVLRLKNADFVVIPSRWEAFGISVLEALAAGKPVLATNVGGIPELIHQSETGLLCEPDVESLAQGILKMISASYDEDAFRRQQLKIWNNLNWSVYMKQYMRVVKSVIAS